MRQQQEIRVGTCESARKQERVRRTRTHTRCKLWKLFVRTCTKLFSAFDFRGRIVREYLVLRRDSLDLTDSGHSGIAATAAATVVVGMDREKFERDAACNAGTNRVETPHIWTRPRRSRGHDCSLRCLLFTRANESNIHTCRIYRARA